MFFASSRHPLAFLGVAALIAASSVQSAPVFALGFSGPITAGVGNQPFHVAVADLNEDGRPDLLVTSTYETTISILLGEPGPSWGPRTLMENGSPLSALAISDVDRDGHQDLLAAYQTNAYVSVFLGDGHGNLTLASTPSTGLYPSSIVAGDFNRDGWPDFATANPGTLHCCHSVTALTGTGGGEFAATGSMNATRDMNCIATADLDEDGVLDLVAGSEEFGLLFYHGNGDGSFQSASAMSVPGYLGDVATADLNRDGHEDLVVAGSPVSALVMLGNGNGTFGPPIPLISGDSGSAAVADFDLDGNLDVATTVGDSAVVVLGHGDGTFGPSVFVPCEGLVRRVASSDMNADGKPDLITLYGTTVAVFLNHGSVGVENRASRSALDLAGLRPNPALAELRVAFTLPSAAPATLELLDVSGRRIAARGVGSLGPGPHVVTLTRDMDIRAGAYWLRLSQGPETRVARAVLLY